MKGGLQTGPIINYMLRKPSLKKYARMWLMSKGIRNYSKTTFSDDVKFWQAGKGLGNIDSVKSVAEVMKEFTIEDSVGAESSA